MTEENKVIIPVHRPDLREKLFFALSGVIVSIPITLYFNVFSSHLCFILPLLSTEICTSALFAPIIEEFAKAYPLFYRHGETGRSIFTLGFLTGLGFGITEFFLYVFGADASIIIRLPAILFHASSTSIIAYGIATHRAVPFYLIAVGLHLINNFFAISGPFWLIAGPITLIVTYALSIHFYRKTEEKIIV